MHIWSYLYILKQKQTGTYKNTSKNKDTKKHKQSHTFSFSHTQTHTQSQKLIHSNKTDARANTKAKIVRYTGKNNIKHKQKNTLSNVAETD